MIDMYSHIMTIWSMGNICSKYIRTQFGNDLNITWDSVHCEQGKHKAILFVESMSLDSRSLRKIWR